MASTRSSAFRARTLTISSTRCMSTGTRYVSSSTGTSRAAATWPMATPNPPAASAHSPACRGRACSTPAPPCARRTGPTPRCCALPATSSRTTSAAAAADVVRLDVAGNAQHRGVGPVRRAQGGAGVEHARPRHAGECADAAGGFGVAIGHVAAALLVPVDDETYLVPVLIQRVDEIVSVRARNAEDRVDAIAYQRSGDRLAGAQCFRVAHSKFSLLR